MGRTTIWIAILMLALSVAQPARTDYAAGQRAWDAGRPDAALTQWRAAANAGDRQAMLALGRLYVQGLGVLQDYVEAHKWLNLAASRGEAAALNERDALAEKMTPVQIATAQERAVAWRPGANGAGDAPDASVTQAPVTVPTPDETDAADTGPPPPPRAIREAQSLLGALGYRPGPADGIWGRRTGEAYRAFLRDVGLPATQMLTVEGLRAMRTFAKRVGGGAETNRGTTAADAARAPSEASAPRTARLRPDALHRAAKAGDIEGLKAALAAGVDVNARDGRGWTALFMAAAHGHTEIIGFLMRAGADVSIKGPKGKTAAAVAQVHPDPAVRKAMGIHQAGDVFRDCAECPEMVVIPAGSFMMGSPAGEKGRFSAEGPVHRVTIGDPLPVGRYEVTFAEWDACSRGGGCSHVPNDKGWGRGNRPVINVSWNDARAYVGWLSKKTGKAYRLLSESEWEYAARAGTKTPFHYGRTISTGQANYNGNFAYGSGRKGKYRGQTTPVGTFPSNRFGLHDVHGNVMEWVEDCWHGSYQGAPSDGSAWAQGGDCSRRVVRGGSWYSGPRNLRSAFRLRYSRYSAGGRLDYVGFRVARTLTP